MSSIDLVIPDIGNFDAVPIVDVLVKVGDTVELETPLITLETDKATMDVPSAAAGTITELLVKRGDKVGKGTVIARVSAAAGAAPPAADKSPPEKAKAPAPAPAAAPQPQKPLPRNRRVWHRPRRRPLRPPVADETPSDRSVQGRGIGDPVPAAIPPHFVRPIWD